MRGGENETYMEESGLNNGEDRLRRQQGSERVRNCVNRKRGSRSNSKGDGSREGEMMGTSWKRINYRCIFRNQNGENSLPYIT